jgi:hypothetical protein
VAVKMAGLLWKLQQARLSNRKDFVSEMMMEAKQELRGWQLKMSTF